MENAVINKSSDKAKFLLNGFILFLCLFVDPKQEFQNAFFFQNRNLNTGGETMAVSSSAQMKVLSP
jgi:hypothetical protein